uniref:Uncharacterized protein n=1 Tax=Pithovirus LCPAC401 TaxID=2506595 RepID=A0A481ZB02_9VIRU|nr:MAG: hypothetical protein LCPAC401_02730 [Pithovirus LCPAC401]
MKKLSYDVLAGKCKSIGDTLSPNFHESLRLLANEIVLLLDTLG